MTDPLRLDRPRDTVRGEDLGDVLASIRRLIAQEGEPARTPAPTPATRPPKDDPAAHPTAVPAQAAATAMPDATRDAGPDAAGVGVERPATPLPLSPARTAALTSSLSDAVDAAAARMADAARRVEAVRQQPSETPFRLNPDALIPSAPARPAAPEAGVDARAEARAEAPARLSPRLSVVEGGTPADRPDIGDGAATPVGTADRITQPRVPGPDTPPAGAIVPNDAAGLASDETRADPARRDARQDNFDMTAPTPDSLTLTTTEPTMDAHPLRNLLRDAIRDELRGEFSTRIEGDLRRMVREELAAALTEAFGKPATA